MVDEPLEGDIRIFSVLMQTVDITPVSFSSPICRARKSSIFHLEPESFVVGVDFSVAESTTLFELCGLFLEEHGAPQEQVRQRHTTLQKSDVVSFVDDSVYRSGPVVEFRQFLKVLQIKVPGKERVPQARKFGPSQESKCVIVPGKLGSVRAENTSRYGSVNMVPGAMKAPPVR